MSSVIYILDWPSYYVFLFYFAGQRYGWPSATDHHAIRVPVCRLPYTVRQGEILQTLNLGLAPHILHQRETGRLDSGSLFSTDWGLFRNHAVTPAIGSVCAMRRCKISLFVLAGEFHFLYQRHGIVFDHTVPWVVSSKVLLSINLCLRVDSTAKTCVLEYFILIV